MSDRKRRFISPKDIAFTQAEGLPINFDQEAAFRYILTLSDGRIVDKNGESKEEIAQLISRCKFGEIKAAGILANRIFRTAIANDSFLRFIQESHDEGKRIVLTSYGVLNVPTASKLIIDRLASQLNTFLHRNGYTGVTLDRPLSRKGDDDESSTRNLLSSGEFKNKRVIFVDDVLKQPSQAEKTKDVIIRHGLASKVFFLYAAQLDSEDPVEFEKIISHRVYNNDLESLIPLLMEPNSFMVVHRLALAVLDPQNVPRLADFFHKLPEETVVKLYEAATSGDFRSRYNGRYLISTAILQQELHDRGWVDIDGFLFETKSLKPLETEQSGESHRIVSYYLNSRQDISFEEAEFYSLMKYGDPYATHHIAEQMAQRLLADEQVMRMISKEEDLIMTSSPSGEVKTAAAHLVDHIETILSQVGIKIRRVKIHRRGNFATQNFGQMTQEQRQREMKARQIEFDQKDEEFVRGKKVIVVDDLYATGSHEQAAKGLLNKVGAEGIYLYHIQFGETLKVNEPDTEEWLNRAAMVSLYDLFYRLLQLDLATQPPEEK